MYACNVIFCFVIVDQVYCYFRLQHTIKADTIMLSMVYMSIILLTAVANSTNAHLRHDFEDILLVEQRSYSWKFPTPLLQKTSFSNNLTNFYMFNNNKREKSNILFAS